ncbi:hypothetical protein G7Y89_g10107 [Cudoniella acicularis]|uniref:FAD-binding domain-containing protein n=1 Tax=Cudoniella acicularis TaxID=354080 RepID=A0A8H4RFP4_9HELO|nr:hypothetical protein G7Y89_g10107 [Cudoniella acicularis]
MSKPQQAPVLIVGGGIVGLSASLFLSSHGINSLLVERHTGTSIHPRARGVNSRTMELYRELGIDEAIRLAGASLSLSMGIYKGSSLVSVIEPHKRKEKNGSGKFPFESFVEKIGPTRGTRGTQDLIEPVLLAAARNRGGDVRFNTECIAFDQDDNGIKATMRDRSDGSESIVHADYMIAADGAGSPIRQKLGVQTTGAGTLGYLLNILFEADLRELVQGREFSMCLIEHPKVRGLFTSINNSNRWVFHLSYDPSKGEKVGDFSPQRCEELVKIALGLPDIEVEIKSILPWEPTVRVAEQFQYGRLFLAGDAAHQMPPWGGQGANTGIADVHNLAWKLATVLHGRATEALLATYDAERVPIGRLVSEESGAAADEHGLFSLDKSFRTIWAIIRRVPRIAGFGYQYTSQGINTEDTTPFPWSLRWLLHPLQWFLKLDGKAGTRTPHLWVQRKGQRISTLDILGKSFVLFVGADGEAWCKNVPSVFASVGVVLEAYQIGPVGDLVCSKGEWESLAGISSTGALLGLCVVNVGFGSLFPGISLQGYHNRGFWDFANQRPPLTTSPSAPSKPLPPMKAPHSRFDPNFTQHVIEATGPKATPGMRQVMGSLIRHLHDFARENEITVDEWMAGVNMINWAGKMSDEKMNEGQLLCDVIGLESLVDEITFKLAAETNDHATATRDLQTKKPVVGAWVDVWQASTNRLYEQQDKNQVEHNVRGKFKTDDNGRYALYCLRPTPYPVPNDGNYSPVPEWNVETGTDCSKGPAGKLLEYLDRHPYRPAHIHLIITREGYKPVTTQIFDSKDKYLENDSVFAVKNSLIVDFKPLKSNDKATLELEYDILVAKVNAAA